MRRPLRAQIAVAAACVAVGAIAVIPMVASADDPPPEPTPPANVVVIYVDDARWDELDQMPNLANLVAAQGTTFTNAFVANSLCCPARATFHSGQYSHNNGVEGNTGFPLFDQSDTLATWFAAQGYHSALMGKYMNGYNKNDDQPPGWTDWAARIGDQRYNRYKLMINGVLTEFSRTSPDWKYSTDYYADRSVAQIQAAALAGQPLLMMVNTDAPHTPATPATRHKKQAVVLDAPAPSFTETDRTDKPAFVSAATMPSSTKLTAARRNRLRSLLAVDDLIGRVVDTLSTEGMLDSTYLVVTSDNGYMLGEHGLAFGKRVAYEESLRVPLIVRGPGIPAGVTNDAYVANIDLAATIAEWGGVTPTRVLDGRSLTPILTDPRAFDDRALLLHVEGGPAGSSSQGQAFANPTGNGVRTLEWKYVRYETGERELYHLAADPYEMDSLHNDPVYDEVEAYLDALTTQLLTCAGATCQVAADVPWPPPPPPTTTTTVEETTTTTAPPEETTTTTALPPEETTTTTALPPEETTTTTEAPPVG